MDKPVVKFKFIGGAGFVRIGHRARIMVLDHPKSPTKGWEVANTSPVLKIDHKNGMIETQNTLYSLYSGPFVDSPHEYVWKYPAKGELPAYEKPVLLVVKGEYKVGELRREKGSYEDGYASYDYWMDSDERQDWEWGDVTAWAELPPLPQVG